MYLINYMLVYNYAAWSDLMRYITSASRQAGFLAVLSQADEHYVSPNGDHCVIVNGVDLDLQHGADFSSIVWDYLDNYTTRNLVHHKMVYHSDWTEHTLGNWASSPFKTKTKKTFQVGARFPVFSGPLVGGVTVTGNKSVGSATVVSPAKAPVKPAVNNYTCPYCKNTKCSTTEKTCWVCGSNINQ